MALFIEFIRLSRETFAPLQKTDISFAYTISGTQLEYAKPGNAMTILVKFAGYVFGILVGAALLAPPLYWGAQGLIEADILPILKQFRFPKYFNRAALICALVGLYPFLKSLKLQSWEELGILPNSQKRRDLLLGICVGALGLGLAAWVMVASGHSVIRPSIRWHRVGEALLTATAVSLLEETFFRGVLYGLLRRHLSFKNSISVLSVVFAALHFLKPHPSLKKFHGDVSWSSGFEIIPKLFWQFGNLELVVGGLITLVLVGAILAYVTEKTKSLWMAIGIHGGWVFALRSFMYNSSRVGETSFWFGRDLITGATPLAMLLLTAALLILSFRKWPRTSSEQPH